MTKCDFLRTLKKPVPISINFFRDHGAQLLLAMRMRRIQADSRKKFFIFITPCMARRQCKGIKVARNEVKNASFAQRSAHRDSRIWRPELIEPAAERKRRARRRRRTSKSAYSDP